MRRVRMPLHGEQPTHLYADGQEWRVLEVRGRWMRPAPTSAQPSHEVERWVLLIEGPPIYDAGESAVRQVIVSAFAADGAWWMDVS